MLKRLGVTSFVCLWLGYLVMRNQYDVLLFSLVLWVLYLFFSRFEGQDTDAKELVMLSVMIGLGVVGKWVFFFIPSVDPLVAIVILSGVHYGSSFGFVVGAVAPFLANMLFTQGPWTPFQMMATGFIGFLSGLVSYNGNRLMTVKLGLLALLSGMLYSFFMDIWTVLSIDGAFSWKRYMMVLVPAIPFTVTYMVSNSVFVLLLHGPMSTRLNRIKEHY